MQWGMISYYIPLEDYSDTDNGYPPAYAAIAAQKDYTSLYLMSVYGHPQMEKWFKSEYKAREKKLNMGKILCAPAIGFDRRNHCSSSDRRVHTAL